MQIFGNDIRFGVHSGPQNTNFDDYRDLGSAARSWLRLVSDFDHSYPIHSDPGGRSSRG